LDQTSAQLEQAAQQAGLEDEQALRQALLPEATARHLQRLHEDWNTRQTQLRAWLQANEQEQQALQQTTAPALPPAEVNAQLQTVQEAMAQNNRLQGSLSAQLLAHEQLQQQHQELLNRRQQQQAQYLRWHNLNQLIGSASGDKFSNFAQGLTLQHLVLLANQRLHSFNNRYTLTKSQTDNLDIEITDGWQADISRPIASLSGGETFLVSLALALALSDLASNKVQIQSLFIDEGFGTLDAETLEVAMDALEGLRSSGKSIGVISHVEAMKERIATQIQVNKGPGGYSRIEVVQG
ncbi:MAG TPA: SbcC/MukB-like Walker B domain-containing protein, partial [Phnomibacter sp.]|nr:SbcC/MukB-like Walker B domain-containing protein [Phnomibacter sp.]